MKLTMNVLRLERTTLGLPMVLMQAGSIGYTPQASVRGTAQGSIFVVSLTLENNERSLRLEQH